MSIGDLATAAGYPLVPGTGEAGRARYGAQEINRTRDFVAQVKSTVPTSAVGYQMASGMQHGVAAATLTVLAIAKTGTVVFPVAFAVTPTLILSVQDTGNRDWVVNAQNLTATSFVYRIVQNRDDPVQGTSYIHWLAIAN